MEAIALLNCQLAELAHSAWPEGAAALARERHRFASAPACAAVQMDLGARRRLVADGGYTVLALGLLRAKASVPANLARLLAAVSLLHRGNLLHARGGWLSTPDTGQRVRAVLVGDCCLSGALCALVGLASLPVLGLFADASVLTAEHNVRALPRPAGAGTALHVALARSIARLGWSEVDEAACTEIGEAFVRTLAAVEQRRNANTENERPVSDWTRRLHEAGGRSGLLRHAALAFNRAGPVGSRSPLLDADSCPPGVAACASRPC